MKPTKTKALVILSGGQDSTTALAWAIKHFLGGVEAISFNYGQRHSIELECAEAVCDKWQIPHTVLPIGTVGGQSALTNATDNVNEPHAQNKDLPNSFVAGRNIVFLALASGIAFDKGITNLVTGFCQTDYSGYPDCRNEFVSAMEKALTLGLDRRIAIHTPLMFLSKAEIWRMAKELDVLETIIEHTHTDYYGNRTDRNEWGYGALNNPASVLRAKGYHEAKERGWL